MSQVLLHPFFRGSGRTEAPPLEKGDKSHLFLSHFQGNAGPRCMTLKYAVQEAAPGAVIWLDQDQRDKTEEGMRDGVLHAQYFVLFLTEGIFSRWFCKMEIRTVSCLLNGLWSAVLPQLGRRMPRALALVPLL